MFATKQSIPYSILFLIALVFAGPGCSGPAANDTPHNNSQAMQPTGQQGKMVLYQIFTRLFGNTNTTNTPYGTLQQNGVGKFNDINTTALTELRNMGITHVWYTGVVEHAVVNDYSAYGIAVDDADVVKGRAGSPYAIKDYYDVNPDLATEVPQRMAEFEALVQRTHDEGLKVIIDFVPNHVARKYVSDAKPEGVEDLGASDDTGVFFSNQNNFYYLPGEAFQVPADYQPLGQENTFATKDGGFAEMPAKVTGNNQITATPHVNDWFETVKLNYGVNLQTGQEVFDPIPDTWTKTHAILTYWLEKGVDGFRCDMAEMVPVAYWEWVIPKLKQQFPEVVFIAEIYNPAQYGNYITRGSFDYLYDKVQLYDTLKAVIQGRNTAEQITVVMDQLAAVDDHMLRFLENHDEQRIASADFAGEAYRALPAMVASATLGKGPVMVYFGQEVGEPGLGAEGFGGEDGRTTIFDYWGVPEHQKWVNGGAYDGGALNDSQKLLRNIYKDLLLTVNKDEAFAMGNFVNLSAYNYRQPNWGYSPNVYAFLRTTASSVVLVACNFNTGQEEHCQIFIPDQYLSQPNPAANSGSIRQLFPESPDLRGTLSRTEGGYILATTLANTQSVILKLK